MIKSVKKVEEAQPMGGIQSKVPSEQYRQNWERIFGKKQQEKKDVKHVQ